MKRIILTVLFALYGTIIGSSDDDRPEFKVVNIYHVFGDGDRKVSTNFYFDGICYYAGSIRNVSEQEHYENANDFCKFDVDVDPDLKTQITRFFKCANEKAEEEFAPFAEIQELNKEQFINTRVNVLFYRLFKVKKQRRQCI